MENNTRYPVCRAAVISMLVAYLRASDQGDEFVIIPGPESVQRVLDATQGPFEYTTRATLSARTVSNDQSRPATNSRRQRVFARNELWKIGRSGHGEVCR